MCPMTFLDIWLLEENLSNDLNKITNIILQSHKLLLSYIVKDIYILLGLRSSWEKNHDLLTSFLAPRLLNGLPSHLSFSLYKGVLWSQTSKGHNGLSITKEEEIPQLSFAKQSLSQVNPDQLFPAMSSLFHRYSLVGL